MIIELSSSDKKLIQVLREGLPLSSTPFKEVAEKASLTEEEVLLKIKEWRERGVIRRFGVLLRHREVGLAANAMIVWQVEPERVEEVGELMAFFGEVSHCYERPTFEDWSYNLYTMVHGKTRRECEQIGQKISRETGISQYKLLFSTKEYKKESPRYFQ